MTRITELELEQLVDELGASLVLFARQWCSCPDDAVQEALIELVKKYPAPRSPKAWLFLVVRNKAMNLARSDRRRERHELASAEQDAWFDADTGSQMDAELTTQWLERLPDIQRQIVTARIWGDLTFEQIAEVVDRPTASVFRLFRESIDSIRQRLITNEAKSTTAERKRGMNR
ncbi:MAG: sigma-70 family RNA polymerase sigma factor [Planctomycetes bacterium]|nr:sigma-70 family RNA polymerase sigma factor [Planctomycetota bacterium]